MSFSSTVQPIQGHVLQDDVASTSGKQKWQKAIFPLARMREEKEWKICFREAVVPYGSRHLGSLVIGQESWGFTLVLSPADCVTLSKLGLGFHLCEMGTLM